MIRAPVQNVRGRQAVTEDLFLRKSSEIIAPTVSDSDTSFQQSCEPAAQPEWRTCVRSLG